MEFIKRIKKARRRKTLLMIIKCIRLYRRCSMRSYSNKEIRNLIVKNHLCREKYLTVVKQVDKILHSKEHGKSKRVIDILEKL